MIARGGELMAITVRTNEIAERLKAIRNIRKISQEKMAELLGVTYSTYVKIENANQNLTIKHLINICDVLNITSDSLLFGDIDNSKKLNFEEFVSYSNIFSEDELKSTIEKFQKMLKLKDK